MATNSSTNVATAATGTVLIGQGVGSTPVFSAAPTVTSITFGAGNALSTYATGTFTPTMVGATTAGTTTYALQQGYYVRIGSLVQVQFVVSGTAATGTGLVAFGGLPFAIKNQTNGAPLGSILNNSSGAAWVFPAGTTYLNVLGTVGGTTANVFASGSGSAGNFLSITNAAFNFQVNMMYEI